MESITPASGCPELSPRRSRGIETAESAMHTHSARSGAGAQQAFLPKSSNRSATRTAWAALSDPPNEEYARWSGLPDEC